MNAMSSVSFLNWVAWSVIFVQNVRSNPVITVTQNPNNTGANDRNSNAAVFTAIMDLLIALAYFAIPCEILYFLRFQPDFPDRLKRVLWLFIAFITACGCTHTIHVFLPWHNAPLTSAFAKTITAIVSLYTAFLLFYLLPRALYMPVHAQEMEYEMNSALDREKSLRDKTQVMSEFREATHEIRRYLDKEKILHITVNEFVKMFKCERCIIYQLKFNRYFSPVAEHHARGITSMMTTSLDPDDPILRNLFDGKFPCIVKVEKPNDVRRLYGGNLPAGSQVTLVPFAYEYENEPQKGLVALHCEHENCQKTSVIADKQHVLLTDLVEQLSIALHQARLSSDSKRQIEQLAEQNAALAKAHKEIIIAKQQREFVSVMSHEMRTPLFAILALASLALESDVFARFPENDPESNELYDNLSIIKRSTDFLLSIVNNVLDFSLYEDEKFALASAPFNVRESCEGALEIATLYDGEKHKEIAMTYDYDPRIPPLVIGDTVRFCQIIINLLSNAFKHTPENGVVGFNVKLLRPITDDGALIKDRGSVGLELVVSDTGPGIKTEDMNKLFSKFTQLDSTSTRKVGGTGLGLSIVKQLTQLMNGCVWVEHNEPTGAKFIARVFLAPFVASEWPDTPLPPPPHNYPLNLSIISHDSRIQDCISRDLQKLGATTCLYNGIYSLMFAGKDQLAQIDGLICDMQGMDTGDIDLYYNLVQNLPEGVVLKLASSTDPYSKRWSRTKTDELEKKSKVLSTKKPLKLSVIEQFLNGCEALKVKSDGEVGRAMVAFVSPQNTSSPTELVELALDEAFASGPTPPASSSRETLLDFEDTSSSVPSLLSPPSSNVSSPVPTPEPQVSPTTAHPQPAQNMNTQFSALKIMVVEDNTITQKVMRKILNKNGIEPDIANDGEEALEKIKQKEFDLIFMDYSMPRMDGITCTKRIRSFPSCSSRKPYIIALSANGMVADRLRFLEAGMNEVLTKPVRPREVSEAIQRVFEMG